jgi:hypothetical protein
MVGKHGVHHHRCGPYERTKNDRAEEQKILMSVRRKNGKRLPVMSIRRPWALFKTGIRQVSGLNTKCADSSMNLIPIQGTDI